MSVSSFARRSKKKKGTDEEMVDKLVKVYFK